MGLDDLKISIITISYNNAAGLEETIRSVIAQTYKNIEYIVIDGGSSDHSKAIIANHEASITYWVSEQDKGIFNAMNKGIKAATGDYLLFINSGDLLMDKHVIQDVINIGLKEELVYGNQMIIDGALRTEWIPDAELTFSTFFKTSIPHQSTFIKRDLFDTVGLYNENYTIISDWAFFLIAVSKHGCSYRHVDRFIALFNKDGISSDPVNYPTLAKERLDVFEQYFPFFYKDYERFAVMEREMQKIAYFRKARYFVKKMIEAAKLGPSR